MELMIGTGIQSFFPGRFTPVKPTYSPVTVLVVVTCEVISDWTAFD